MKILRMDQNTTTDKETFLSSIKSRIYFASRDGLSLVLYDLLNLVEDAETRNRLIDEVNNTQIKYNQSFGKLQ
jgi:hypothetical protein